MSSSSEGSEKMADESDSLGPKADRNMPVELPRATGSYTSVGNEEAIGIMSTHCNPSEFCNVVSNLSAPKIKAVREMGFGHLQDMKMDMLKGSIWVRMVDEVDLSNSSVRICGTHHPLSPGQFTRYMGITDGVFDVVLGDKPTEMASDFMKKVIRDKEGPLSGTVQRSDLIEVVRNRDAADHVFKICYALYALSTIICPGMNNNEVDIRLVECLIRAKRIRDYNWASYAVDFLVQGVRKHRLGETDVVVGCMVFIQLMYLDIVAKGLDVVDRTLLPVITAWTTDHVNKVIEQVNRLGGFGAPLLIHKEIPYMKTLCEFMNDDGTVGIGINRSIHEDVYVVKAGVYRANRDISGIKIMCGEFRSELNAIRQLVVEMDETVARRKEDRTGEEIRGKGSNDNSRKRCSFSAGVQTEWGKRPCTGQSILLEDRNKPVCARRLSLGDNKRSSPATPKQDTGALSESSSSPGANTGKMNELNNGTKGPAKRQTIPRSHVRLMYNNDLIKTSCWDAIQPLEFPDPGPRTESHPPLLVGGNHYMAGPYQLRRPLPPTDVRLVNYVFLGGRETSNAEDIMRMAQCGEWGAFLHRITIKCLAPRSHVTSDVINYFCEFLSRENPGSWFIPTYFSQNANGQRQGHTQNEWIARTRNICNMVRFDRRLDSCSLIFVPIHSGNLGELGGHWWLLVIDPRRQVAEIWDSAPSTSSLPVRTRMAYNVLSHLQETVRGTLPGHDFQQYRTMTPANVPIQPNGFDCAIFVIQHMQYYGTRWWIDYHSDEQRSGILLQCMKSPASDIHDEVRRRADDYYFGRLC